VEKFMSKKSPKDPDVSTKCGNPEKMMKIYMGKLGVWGEGE
jgi:hypothetical protein